MSLGIVKDGFLQKMWMGQSNNSNLKLAFQAIIKVYLSKKEDRIYFIYQSVGLIYNF